MNKFVKSYLSLLSVVISVFVFSGHSALAGTCTSATMINSVPFYINVPGTYCLGSNLTYISASTSTTSAIEIAASNVTLDLNGKTLSGRFANNTVSHGLELGIHVKAFVYGHPTDVVIRNGTVTGFRDGISTGSKTNADRLVIEDMNITSMANRGIFIGYGYGCNDCVIGNNVITGINPNLETNQGALIGGYGIQVHDSDRVNIYDNFIFDLKSNDPGFSAYGIYLKKGYNTVVDNNTISNISSAGYHVAIFAQAYDVAIQDNNLLHFNRGIWYRFGFGVYSGTLYTDVNIPYTGGTDGGGNQ